MVTILIGAGIDRSGNFYALPSEFLILGFIRAVMAVL